MGKHSGNCYVATSQIPMTCGVVMSKHMVHRMKVFASLLGQS